jgi:hypothetical protein
MKYEKPEIVVLGTAIEGVQFLCKTGGSTDCLNEPTNSAYQADE